MTPLVLLAAALGDPPPPQGDSVPVGRSVTIHFHDTGPELRARPNDDRRRPFVVQSVDAQRGEGGFFYAIKVYGLDPGTHDLRDGLERCDGGPMTAIRPMPWLTVTSGLPPGHVPPADLPAEPGPQVGGYFTLLLLVGAIWAVGLLALLVSFFLPRRRTTTSDRPVTLADRLRPLVAGAAAGTLKRDEVAALERALVAYWRTRRGWNDADPHTALRRLHADPEAGPLLAQLEAWLHRPTPSPPADVGALLAPYRELPADTVELPTG